jgi:hypothetical protein
MSSISDELKKAGAMVKAMGGYVSRDKPYIIGEAGNHHHGLYIGEQIQEKEALLCLAIGNKAKSLTVLDILQCESRFDYASKLGFAYNRIIEGMDVEDLIDNLLQDMRHPDEKDSEPANSFWLTVRMPYGFNPPA